MVYAAARPSEKRLEMERRKPSGPSTPTYGTRLPFLSTCPVLPSASRTVAWPLEKPKAPLKGTSIVAAVMSMKYQPSAFQTTARPSEKHWAKSNSKSKLVFAPDFTPKACRPLAAPILRLCVWRQRAEEARA